MSEYTLLSANIRDNHHNCHVCVLQFVQFIDFEKYWQHRSLADHVLSEHIWHVDKYRLLVID